MINFHSLSKNTDNKFFVAHAATGGSFLDVKKGTKEPRGLPPLDPLLGGADSGHELTD